MFKIFNLGSHRHYDENGFLYIDETPVLRAGVLEYLGSELIDGGQDEVDGVKLIPEKVYKVYLPLEELEKAKDTFKMLPVVDDHTWLGEEGEDSKKFEEGMTGETPVVKDGKLFISMKLTGKNILNELKNGKEELSASYTNQLKKSDNPNYDFIAFDYRGNHIALVDKGRCGPDVRVLNTGANLTKKENFTMANKVKNGFFLEIDGKRVDLGQFFKEEANEKEDGSDVHGDSIASNEDKREIIREIMAVSGKPNEEFKGGEDEKIETVAKLAEKLAYNPSETSKTDNDCDGEPKVKNEENDDEEDKKVDFQKIENSITSKIQNSIKNEEEAKKRAYNTAKNICGDFNAFGMSAKDIYMKALNEAGVSVSGSETTRELEAMLKVANSVKVDNGFSYNTTNSDEEELSEIEV